MKQRIFSLILALALLCTLLPAVQAVEYPLTFLYLEENGEAHITGYYGQIPEVLVIPESLDGLPVTAIMHYAFQHSAVQKLVLPSTMRTLCQNCFAFTPLTEVALNDGLKEISSGAFAQTKLTRVTIPASVTSLAGFSEIDTLTDLYILGTEVSGYLSTQCRLFCHQGTELAEELSYSITEVYYFEELPFDPLTDEIVTEGELQYVLHDGEATLWSCWSEGDVVIPDTLGGCPVVCIAPKCFTGDVRKLTLPDSIRSILRGSCRAQYHLQSVNLPASLEYIGENAFVNLSLGRIELPKSLTCVDANAFHACGITELICNDALRTIGDDAFSTQPLASVTLNDGLEAIGARAFYGTNVTELTVPASVTDCKDFLSGSRVQTVYGYPGSAAEVECDEAGITFVNLLTGQANPAAYDKTVDGLIFRIHPVAGYAALGAAIPALLDDQCVVPETVDGFPVRRINSKAFTACDFTCVYLPDTVTEICQSAFLRCDNLRLVHMSENIQTLYSNTFTSCDSLRVLYLPTFFSNYQVLPEDIALLSRSLNLVVGYPGTLAEEYCNKNRCHFLAIDPAWDDFIITEDSVYSIKDGEATLRRVYFAQNGLYTVPDEINGYPVTTVGSGAFRSVGGFGSLSDTLALGNNVRLVEAEIFSDGYFPKSIYMPATVESFEQLPPRYAECTIFGTRGSYAEQYAQSAQLAFSDFATVPFTDVPENAWYFPYVHSAYWSGLMNGTSSTTFAPNETTTRAMVVKVLANMSGVDSCGWRYGFSDVPEGQWYTDAVNWGRYYRIVNGTSATTFSPNAPVTREQLAAFLFRYAQVCGVECLANGDMSVFTDRKSISSYALDAVTWAVGADIINGTSKTTISPQAYATRAEIAAMLTRFLAFVNKQ